MGTGTGTGMGAGLGGLGMSLSPAWCRAGMASGSRREEGSAHPHWCLLSLRKYQNTGASTTGAKPRGSPVLEGAGPWP